MENPGEVRLPIHYNQILQASVLHWLENEYSVFLHDVGFYTENRVYKLYTFSNLIGTYVIDSGRHQIVFSGPIQFYLSFYEEESHEFILDNIKKEKKFHLGWYDLSLINCELVREEWMSCRVRTLSPVTVHSTLYTIDGKKKTIYLSPHQKEFSQLIRKNLIHKYDAFYLEKPKDDDFSITPVDNGRMKEIHLSYKKFFISGWKGDFWIKGSPELIKLALLSGIGSRNSIGMGCLLQRPR